MAHFLQFTLARATIKEVAAKSTSMYNIPDLSDIMPDTVDRIEHQVELGSTVLILVTLVKRPAKFAFFLLSFTRALGALMAFSFVFLFFFLFPVFNNPLTSPS